MNINLKNKLLNFEITPPAGVWEKINTLLDQPDAEYKFPTKLYEAEIKPPFSTWNKIAAILNKDQRREAPVLKKMFPFIKYAAAAVVIGLITWGGIQFLNNKKQGNNLVIENKIKENKDSLFPLSSKTVDPLANITETKKETASEIEARDDAALEASKKTFAKLDVPAKRRIREIASGYEFTSLSNHENISGILHGESIINPTDLEACYITLKTPEGKIIRFSKKLGDMICCVYDEDDEQLCDDQMKKWREKIVSTPVNHSSGGFMDILSLVKALQDN